MNTITPQSPCPCGWRERRSLAECCGRHHAGEPAPTAEALMRSRYSAFVLRDRDYLLRTWHADTRPADLGLDTPARWLGLRIIGARDTGPDTAEVEFVARYRVGGGSAIRLRERSRFVRHQGHWLYVDGEQE